MYIIVLSLALTTSQIEYKSSKKKNVKVYITAKDVNLKFY